MSDGNVYDGSFSLSLGDIELADKLTSALRAEGIFVRSADLTDTSKVQSPETKELLDGLIEAGIYEILGQYRVTAYFTNAQYESLNRILLEVLGIDLNAPGEPFEEGV